MNENIYPQLSIFMPGQETFIKAHFLQGQRLSVCSLSALQNDEKSMMERVNKSNLAWQIGRKSVANPNK